MVLLKNSSKQLKEKQHEFYCVFQNVGERDPSQSASFVKLALSRHRNWRKTIEFSQELEGKSVHKIQDKPAEPDSCDGAAPGQRGLFQACETAGPFEPQDRAVPVSCSAAGLAWRAQATD